MSEVWKFSYDPSLFFGFVFKGYPTNDHISLSNDITCGSYMTKCHELGATIFYYWFDIGTPHYTYLKNLKVGVSGWFKPD